MPEIDRRRELVLDDPRLSGKPAVDLGSLLLGDGAPCDVDDALAYVGVGKGNPGESRCGREAAPYSVLFGTSSIMLPSRR